MSVQHNWNEFMTRDVIIIIIIIVKKVIIIVINNNKYIYIAPTGPKIQRLGPKIQRCLWHYRTTKWVWTDGFSSGVWKWECFHKDERWHVESSRWMKQQQRKCDGTVWYVCEERPAVEHRMSAEPEVVHGFVPARWDTLEWLWSAPCESVKPVYRWPIASTEASVASEAVAWRRWDPGSGRRLASSRRCRIVEKSLIRHLTDPGCTVPLTQADGLSVWSGIPCRAACGIRLLVRTVSDNLWRRFWSQCTDAFSALEVSQWRAI